MPVRNTPSVVLLLTTLLLSSSFLAADWTHVHRDATSNAVAPIVATITDATLDPAVTTGPRSINVGSRPVVTGVTAVSVAYLNSPDRVRLRAHDTVDGSPMWESVDLDEGLTISFGSVSSPTLDPANDVLYYGSGASMQKISLVDGSVVWAKVITELETGVGRATTIVNSSPAIGAGRVFIACTSFGPDAQVVAFDAATGAIEWSAPTQGVGSGTPVYASIGGTDYLFVEVTDGSGGGGIVAYDAAAAGPAGSVLWSHATVANDWVTTGSLWADIGFNNNKLYGVTYDFSADGYAFRVDAVTGELDWMVPTIGTDIAPVVVGGQVILVGGGFGTAEVVLLNAETGNQNTRQPLNEGGNYLYRNYMAATNDVVYLTNSNGFGLYPDTQLLILDPVTGLTSSASTQDAARRYAGPPAIDDLGNVLVNVESDGSLRIFKQVHNSVGDWMMYD